MRRGEVWLVTLDPTRGREQAGTRPFLIVSETPYNQGRSNLVLGIPITSTRRALPHHLPLEPPEGGLAFPSSLLCDGLRSVAKDRFLQRLGDVTPRTLARVEDVLRILLGL